MVLLHQFHEASPVNRHCANNYSGCGGKDSIIIRRPSRAIRGGHLSGRIDVAAELRLELGHIGKRLNVP